MLVSNKINLFSFLFGKHQAADRANAGSNSKAQNFNNIIIDDLDKRISIFKSEDFYKAHAVNEINPLSQLIR